MKSALLSIALIVTLSVVSFSDEKSSKPTISIAGYVRDSGCVHRSPKITKPLPNGCLEACVRAGSPLVILTKEGMVYHPFSSEIPDTDVRQKLLPFAGKLVKVTGQVFKRGGSSAISLDSIEEIKD